MKPVYIVSRYKVKIHAVKEGEAYARATMCGTTLDPAGGANTVSLQYEPGWDREEQCWACKKQLNLPNERKIKP